MPTLISAQETIIKAPAGHAYDPRLLTPSILTAELKYAQKFLSREFYNALIADKKSFEAFLAKKVYVVGEVVLWSNATYYECIQDTTGKEIPNNVAFWTETTPFTTAVYNVLWDALLWAYLAYGALHKSVYKSTYQFTASGPQKKKTDLSDTLSKDEVERVKSDLHDDMCVLRDEMDEFMRANPIDYPLYPPNEKDCGPHEKKCNNLGVIM